MKKLGVLTLVVPLLLLAGCQTQSSSSSHNSAPSSQAPSKVKKTRFALLTSKLEKENLKMELPQTSGLGAGTKNINVRYSKKKNETTVYYSVGNSKKKFNDPSLEKEHPYLTLTKISGLSKKEIASRINYQVAAKGLPTVKLNDETTAVSQGAAGQSYLTWNKDNWSFTVKANSYLGEKPNTTANEVVDLLEDYRLPSKDGKGSMQFIVSEQYASLGNEMLFEKDGNLYQVKAHSIKTMLKMMQSLR